MVISKIVKRDGAVADFDPAKIRDAVYKAFIAVELADGEKADSVTREVVQLLEERFEGRTPTVEDAQDVVVQVLREKGFGQVAIGYQAYREKKQEIRNLRKKLGIEEPKLTVNALDKR